MSAFVSQAQGTVRCMADRDMSQPPSHSRVSVAIGGGIGAGKSSVLEVFEGADFVVIQADAVGHDVLAADHAAGKAVMRRWPSVIVDGAISRPRLAQIVFTDVDALAELEAITHPAIRDEILRLVDGALGAAAVEIPVLGMFATTDWHRIAVIAPEEVRIARAVGRGGGVDDIMARMANQPAEADWVAWADTVIDNGGSWDATLRSLEPFVGSGESA